MLSWLVRHLLLYIAYFSNIFYSFILAWLVNHILLSHYGQLVKCLLLLYFWLFIHFLLFMLTCQTHSSLILLSDAFYLYLHAFLAFQTTSPCISWSTCETPFNFYRSILSTLLKIHFWFWPADDLYVETMQLVQTHDQRKVRDCPLEEQMPLAMYYCTALPSCKFVFCSFTLRTSMFKNSVCKVWDVYWVAVAIRTINCKTTIFSHVLARGATCWK